MDKPSALAKILEVAETLDRWDGLSASNETARLEMSGRLAFVASELRAAVEALKPPPKPSEVSDETRRAWTEAGCRNCWTCGWDEGGSCPPVVRLGPVQVWAKLNCANDEAGGNMPPKEAGPCPGWKEKE